MSITIKLRRPQKLDPIMTVERASELYTKLKPFLCRHCKNCIIYIAWEGKIDDPKSEITFEEFLRYYKIKLISKGDYAT
jgi:hypothetical protein